MKTIVTTIALAAAIFAATAAQAQTTTRCQWEGYGQYKQWVCRQGY